MTTPQPQNEYVVNGKQIFNLLGIGNPVAVPPVPPLPLITTEIGAEGFNVNGSAETWANTHTTVTRTKAVNSLSNPQILAVQKAILVCNNNTTPTASVGIEADNSGLIGTYYGMNLYNNNNTDFGITSTFPYQGSVVFKQEGAGSTTKQTAIKQGTITINDPALQPKTTLTDTEIKVDDNFATTTPATATLTSNNLEIKVVNGPASTVTTTDIFPATIQLANTGDPTTTFSTTTLTSGASSATWADIISGTTPDTLQEVLTAGNTATNLNITLQHSSGASLTLSPVSTNVGAFENFVPTPAYQTAQSLVQIGASSGSLESSMFINDPSVPVQYQTIGKLYQAGDKINDPLNVRPELQCFETFTDGMGTTTKEALYNSTGITATSSGVPYTISTNQQFLINTPNLGLSNTHINFPPSASERSQIEARGFTCLNTAGVGYSWWRNLSAYMSNATNTIFTLIQNSLITMVGVNLNTTYSASDINMVSNVSGQVGSALLRALGRLVLTTAEAGGTTNPPILQLQNTNATGSVFTEIYKAKPTAGSNGDVLYTESIFGKTSLNTKQEYTRITHTIRDPTSGTADGSLEMGCVVNGGFANFIQLNGNDTPIGEVNFTRPLDFIGGSDANSTVKVSGTGSVNLNLDATSSVGAGAIALKTKNGVAGSGAGLLLTGNTLLSPTSGFNAGQHLCLTIGGTPFKIQLLNP